MQQDLLLVGLACGPLFMFVDGTYYSQLHWRSMLHTLLYIYSKIYMRTDVNA